MLGGYDQGRWKTGETRARPIERLVLVGGDAGTDGRAQPEQHLLVGALVDGTTRVVFPPLRDSTGPDALLSLRGETAEKVAGAVVRLRS
jgi:hypothetical protein